MATTTKPVVKTTPAPKPAAPPVTSGNTTANPAITQSQAQIQAQIAAMQAQALATSSHPSVASSPSVSPAISNTSKTSTTSTLPTTSSPAPSSKTSPTISVPKTTPTPTPAPKTTPTPSSAPSASGTPAIPFISGLSATQKAGITALANKPAASWTAADLANWNYATKNAPRPNQGSGTVAPPAPPTAPTSPTDPGASGSAPGASSPSAGAADPGAAGATGPTGATGAADPGAAASASTPAAQYQAMLDAYIKSIQAGGAPSAQEVADQAALDKIIAQQAQVSQSAGANQNLASDQPIEMGFITGQQAAIERRATNAETGLEAQAVPLKTKLAQEQAQRAASMDIASKTFEAESKQALQSEAEAASLAEKNVTANAYKNVAAGASLVDPTTGQVIYTAPPKQTSDAQNYQTAVSQGYKGTLLDYMTAKKGAGASTSLSPDDVNFLAQTYLTTGQIPSLGYGAAAATMKAEVIHAAMQQAQAQGMTGSDVALAKASYQANTSALTQTQKQQAATVTYEKTAKANLQLVSKLSNAVDRTGSPLVNHYLLYLKGQVQGDTDTAQYENAIRGAANEYAKVMTGSLGNAAATDAAAAKAEASINAAMSNGTIQDVIALMNTEMENRSLAFDSEIDTLKSNISESSSAGGSSFDSSSTPSPSSSSTPSSSGGDSTWTW